MICEFDMRRNLPPNVYAERTRHGTRVFYYREGKGVRVRLPSPDHPAFREHYDAAVRGEPIGWGKSGETKRSVKHVVAKEGTIRFVINKYRDEDADWQQLASVTKANRNAIFQKIVDLSGERRIKDVTKADIVRARNKRNTGKGHGANAYLKAIKPVFAFALAEGLIEQNPCEGIPYLEAHTDGYHTWTLDEVRRFQEKHPLGTRAHLALTIFLYTGFRREDVFGLGRQNIRDGIVEVRPRKTRKTSGVMVSLRVLEPLQTAIDATHTGDMVFLLNEYGKPFKSAATFGNWFANRCVEAGVPGRGHGLRKAGATLAAENGATAHDLMAMFGWTKLSQAEVYTRAADRRKLGIAASAKLIRENKQ